MTHRTAYEAPCLTAVGSLEELTLANNKAPILDNNFPSGTPSGEVTDGTFS